ncbi:MAG: hypothetical protein L0Z53_22075 [Acidobacteriales bacterium]|nr:hypothetical protein [Terriglobales bacterium]
MKRIMAVALLATACGVAAQQAPSEPAPRYDVAKEIVVKGVVQETSEYQCPVTGTVGAHMLVQSGPETLQVHITSAKFMRVNEISFKQGDEVRMLGNRVVFNGKPAFLPRSITVGRITYFFRTPGGMLVWW